MHNDTTVLIVLGTFVGLLTWVMDRLDRRKALPQWLGRKILHVGAVGACALAPLWLDDLQALTIIVILVELLLIALVGSGRLFREASGRPGWGIALFPLPYIALLLLFHGPEDRWLIVLPMSILAVSDAAAAVLGTLVPTRSYHLTADRKTVGGSLAFLVSAYILVLVTPSPLQHLDILTLVPLVLMIAVLLSGLEALGSKGSDNLYVPIGAAILLHGAIQGPVLEHLIPALIGMAIAVPFVVLSVRRNWLTLGGAVAASLLGIGVVLFQGPWWLLPLLLFFASSIALGRALAGSGQKSDLKYGSARDAEQVFSNGGVYLLAAVLLTGDQAALVMAVSMAVATADTWASEIGIALRGTPYDILRWRRVTPGLSGAVSLGGTLGGIAGALLLGAVAGLFLLKGADPDHYSTVVRIAGWGVAGMLVDSVLGSALQVRYRHANGSLHDQAAAGSAPVGGVGWMTNDRVNLLSNALVTGSAWLLS